MNDELASRNLRNTKLLGQRECIERIARADNQVLLAIQQVSLRAVAKIVRETGMPKDVAVGGIKSHQVLRAVARKQ